jgi:hypothetical protein
MRVASALSSRQQEIPPPIEAEETDFELISHEELYGFKEREFGLLNLITALFTRIFSRAPEPKPAKEYSLNDKAVLLHIGKDSSVEESEEGELDQQAGVTTIEDEVPEIIHQLEKNKAVYYKDGNWLLQKLRQQVENDLIRSYVEINRERVVSFALLCEKIGLIEGLFDNEAHPNSRLSAQQKNALEFLTMLQQGAMAAALLSGPHLELVLGIPGFHLLQSGLSKKLEEIVELSKKNLVQAIQNCRKACKENPILERYLASAVSAGILKEVFVPNWKLIEEPLPLHLTCFSAVCEDFIPRKLTLIQYMELTLVIDAKITEVYPIRIQVDVDCGKEVKIDWKFA